MKEEAVEEVQEKPVNPYVVAFSMMLPTFFAMVATSGTNVCLPYIAGYYGATQYESNTVITSYMISNGIMLPMTGWLLRTFGKVRLINGCIITFMLGSFLCIISPNLMTLIISRLIQGVGGGALMPLCQSILLEAFPQKRGTAMGLFGFAVILAPLIGPLLGGFLTENYSWQWVFIVNLPFCFISVILVKLFIKENFKPSKKKIDFDIVGFSAIILWLGSMQVVLDKGEQFNWFDETWVCWLTGFSVFAMIFFIVWELEYKKPFVNIRVLKNVNFICGTTIAAVVNIMLYSSILLVPQFVQSLLGYNAYLSGLSVFPRVISCAVMLPIVGKLADVVDNRILIAIGLFILGSTTFMFSNMTLETSLECVQLINLLFGFGIAFTFIPVSAISFATLSKRKTPDGAGLQSLFKCSITAIATSVSTTFIMRVSQVHQTYLTHNLGVTDLQFYTRLAMFKAKFMTYFAPYLAQKKAYILLYKQLLKQARLSAFYDAFLVLSLVAFIVIPLILLLKNKRKPLTHL